MAKNLNSISFTVLLFVVLMASTGILTSEAACGPFIGECGAEPFLGTNAQCTACCVAKYGSPPVCEGIVEFEDGQPHCHCYGPKTV